MIYTFIARACTACPVGLLSRCRPRASMPGPLMVAQARDSCSQVEDQARQVAHCQDLTLVGLSILARMPWSGHSIAPCLLTAKVVHFADICAVRATESADQPAEQLTERASP